MTEKLLKHAGFQQGSLVDRAVRNRLLEKLKEIRHGRLRISDPIGSLVFGSVDDSGLDAHIHIHETSAYRDIALGGGLGAGESFMAGSWQCDRLVDLVRILLRNREVLDALDESWSAALRKPLLQFFHRFNRNSLRGSRSNIAAHYDLGNDFFQLFLDPTMMYSSAIYDDADATLETASVNKLDRICRKLRLRPGDHLLEIGTGWGGLALHAASNYGCRVTTTTISREQYDLASRRVADAGLQDRVTLLLQDYRNLEGQYDKLVSIEMIEAVGWEYFDAYFARCQALLKPGGLMMLQAITIADQQYDRARTSVDFIKRYIFPGGCLPSTTAIARALTANTDMRIVELRDLGLDYARTLADWRARFIARLPEVRELGYDERFVRMWLFYLCYCEGAFREHATSAGQYLLARPGARWQ